MSHRLSASAISRDINAASGRETRVRRRASAALVFPACRQPLGQRSPGVQHVTFRDRSRGLGIVLAQCIQQCLMLVEGMPFDAPPGAAHPAQLAGLRTHRRTPRCSYWPSLPDAHASVPLTAVVPAHRCGTVPDSHRVPSRDAVVADHIARCLQRRTHAPGRPAAPDRLPVRPLIQRPR